MFQFPRFPPPAVCVPAGGDRAPLGRVRPFGYPRIEGRVRLPGAYRGLPRPSSSPCAKASAVRPAYLAPASRRGAMRIIPCFSIVSTIRGCRDRERWNAPRGTTPLQILKCRCLLSLSDRKDRLKSDGESIFEIVPVPRRDGSRRFLLAMRLSRYAGRTPGTGYRGVRGQRGTGGLDAAPGTRHTGCSV